MRAPDIRVSICKNVGNLIMLTLRCWYLDPLRRTRRKSVNHDQDLGTVVCMANVPTAIDTVNGRPLYKIWVTHEK